MTIQKHLSHVAAVMAACFWLSQATPVSAQIQWAGTPIVDLTSIGSDGSTAGQAIWINNAPAIDLGNGLLAGGVGNFTLVGNPSAGPVGFAGGSNGVAFDGVADAYQSAVGAPAGLTGLNPTRSIEVWTFNPAINAEETLVAWGKRGGPGGSNMSFNYGNHGAFGAVGHWGGPDIGWNNAGGAPAAGVWHYLTYTYDGTTTRVYDDGVLLNSEVLGAGAINTHPNTKITLAAQLAADGVTIDPGNKGSLSIGGVRVHDGVLSEAQILNNYNIEAANFLNPPPPMAEQNPAGGGPVHRYSFGDAGSATLLDSVGSANGELKGNNGSQAGGRLNLGGGDQASAAYGDLPNGIISALTDATFEFWVTTENAQGWSRIFDFGSTTTGEQTGPGGVGTGVDYIMLSANIGTSTNQRLEFRAGAGTQTADSIGTTDLGAETHIVVTFDDAADKLNYYKNGELISTVSTANQLSQINDVNNWLGRSNWPDANLDGSYDEVRIYDRALTLNQILGNFQAGPNDLNVVPEPTSAVLLMLGVLTLGGVRRRRRA